MSSVTIKKIVNGGKGLAELDNGMKLFVKYVLPGEVVITRKATVKKGFATAELKTVSSAHPDRTSPYCPYYEQCGGCDLMHCCYSTQIEIKKEIVKDLLARQVKQQSNIDEMVRHPLESQEQYYYRQRIRLQVSDDGELGFRKYQSHQIIPINKCAIARPEINETLNDLNDSDSARALFDLTSEIEIHWNPYTSGVSLIFHLNRKPRPTDLKRARIIINEIAGIEALLFCGDGFAPTHTGAETGNKKQYLGFTFRPKDMSIAPVSLEWETGGFCQVNISQNHEMIQTVLDLARIQSTDKVLDLFCGMGNFSIPLARTAASVYGIEGQGASIRSAMRNCEHNNITNTTFIKADIKKGCDELLKQGALFDCIIVDPPRQGIPDLVETLDQLCRRKLVYISCDPATLCRDLNQLIARGFAVKVIQPIDMFPQTHHIETVVLLEKN